MTTFNSFPANMYMLLHSLSQPSHLPCPLWIWASLMTCFDKQKPVEVTLLVPGLAFQVLAASALALGKPVTMLWSSGWTTEWGETREATWRKGIELPDVVMKTWIFQASQPPTECNHVHDPNWHYMEQNCRAKHCPNCWFKESWKKVKPLLFWVVTFWTGLLHSNK